MRTVSCILLTVERTPIYTATILSNDLPAVTMRKTLDDGYYLEHFWTVIHGVAARYGLLLSFAERRFIGKINALSPQALTLYVRLINRKGPYFRVGKLAYFDPTRLDDAIQELTGAALITPITPDKACCDALVKLFTHRELQAALRVHDVPKQTTKQNLCDWLNDWPGASAFWQTLLHQHALIQLCDSPWDFLKFLYFGQRTDTLSDFVIQALGHITLEAIDADDLRPLFRDRPQADDCYRMQMLYSEFRDVRDDLDTDELFIWWQGKALCRSQLHPSAHAVYDRLCHRLGRIFERAKAIDQAIAIYTQTPVPPSRERLIKLWIKIGNGSAAVNLCENILAEPVDADENYAVRQIYNRLTTSKRRTQATDILQDYPIVYLNWEGQTVEQAALAHYATQDWQGVHSENWLWCNLFGLLFWDIIFDGKQGGFHHPLQTHPHDLFTPHFFAARVDCVDERLMMLHDADRVQAHIAQCHDQKHGITNPFIAWHVDTLETVGHLLSRAPAVGVGAILKQMTRNPGAFCRGFPDLFLWRDDDYQFIEVKSATDRIQPAQFNWLQMFKEAGVKMDVLRVHRSNHIVF